MKKIKILYIHHGDTKAGAARSLTFLINNLDKEKYEPYVLTGKDYEGAVKLFGEAGAKIIYKKGLGPWHGSTVSGISIRKILGNLRYCITTYFITKKVYKEIKPDIIHLNSTCLFICAKAIKKCNKNTPIICHVREPLLEGFWGDILRKNNDKYVDRYIAIEKYDAKSLKTNKKIDIISNFVDIEKYNSQIKSNILRDELKIKQEDTICLCLSRVSKENGILELIQNLTNILEKRKDIHFCFVGVKSKSKYVKNIMKYASKYKNIHLMQFRSDVQNIIASSDINIVPFKEPHFARSIIETSAMGKTTIGRNVGGVNELIKDEITGCIYNSDYSNFETKLLRLVDDKEYRNKLAKNAEKYAKENFEATKNMNKIFRVYNEM